eukprot:COSAG01_NODE_5355_length_4314_cov_6.238197_4_plen_64_part_01
MDAYLQELLANVNLRHDDHLREFLEEEEALQFEKGGHWVEKWFVVQDTMIRCSWHHCASALSPG